MIGLVKHLHRTYKRVRHMRGARARVHALLPTIADVCGGPVRLVPSDGGGHDYIFRVLRENRSVAVLRLANGTYVPDTLPLKARLNGPRLRLTARERIAREHRVCAAGGPLGLTPEPLWISDTQDALLNHYVEGERLMTCVQRGRIGLWDAIARTAERAVAFHAAVGEPHMDMTLMNVLADGALEHLTFIDFELAPNPALSPAEARLFDFLNLVEMAYKFMTPADSEAAPQRLATLLTQTLPAELRQTPLSRLAPKLPRMLADPTFRHALARHLPLADSQLLTPNS